MIIDGDFTFEGKNSLKCIYEDKEKGLINMFFECDGHEQSLVFEPNCFKTIGEMMDKYLTSPEIDAQGRKAVDNFRATSGRVKPDITLWMEEDDVSIEVPDWDLPEENNPVLKISSRNGRVTFCFNIAQAKEIADRCMRLIEIRKALKDVRKKKVVKARVNTA